MCDHQITITTDDQGDFTYSPSTLHAKVGETVYWTSAKGPFAVSFIDQTPFSGVSFSSKKNSQGEHVIDAIQVEKDTIGHHHYAVALAVTRQTDHGDPTTQVVLDSGCPDIVVSDN